jgi:dihydroorotase
LPVTNRYGTTEFEQFCPELFDVAKRDVLLDVGHGKSSFSWKLAELGMKEGLKPNTISTDLWVGNLHGPVFDMPTTMAKLLHLGMSLEEVVKASTATPAAAIGRLGEIGTLKPGAHADISLFKPLDGKFPLVDCYGEIRVTARKLEPVNVIHDGKIIF